MSNIKDRGHIPKDDQVIKWIKESRQRKRNLGDTKFQYILQQDLN